MCFRGHPVLISRRVCRSQVGHDHFLLDRYPLVIYGHNRIVFNTAGGKTMQSSSVTLWNLLRSFSFIGEYSTYGLDKTCQVQELISLLHNVFMNLHCSVYHAPCYVLTMVYWLSSHTTIAGLRVCDLCVTFSNTNENKKSFVFIKRSVIIRNCRYHTLSCNLKRMCD